MFLEITSDTTSDGNAGTIDINAANLQMDGANISTSSTGFGNSGDINITAGDIDLVNGAKVLSEFDGLGTATDLVGGTITITATASTLDLSGGSEISTSTHTPSDAGFINIVDFETVTIDASSISSSTTSTGSAGALGINATSILLDNGGSISTDSTGYGDAGILAISASQIDILNGSSLSAEFNGDGENDSLLGGAISLGGPGYDSGYLNLAGDSFISTSTNTPAGAGAIAIFSFKSVKLDDSHITSSTTGEGNGGQTIIFAPEVDLLNGSSIRSEYNGDGVNPIMRGNIGIGGQGIDSSYLYLSGGSSISTDTNTPSSPDGVFIANFASVTLTENSSITSSTTGDGDAGLVWFRDIGNLTLDGSTIAVSSTGDGNTGDIDIEVGDINLLNGSSITAEFVGDGTETGVFLDPGDIKITALTSHFEMSGGSVISSNTNTSSNAGSIFVNDFDLVNITDSEITSSSTGTTDPGNAGNITIGGGEHADHDDGSSIFMTNSAVRTESTADGGNIDIRASYMIHLVDSVITTNSAGAGGDIFIDPIFLIINNTIISANAIALNAGNITLIAENLFVSGDSIIEATSQFGSSGTISGSSPEGDTTAGTKALKAAYQDSSKLLKKSCSLQTAEDNSGSMVVEKTRGLPASPEEMLMAYDPSILDKNSSSYALASAIADADDEKFKPVQVASANALQKGDKAFRGGDYDTAEEELKIASSLLSGTDNKVSRGATLQKLGQTQQALGKYQESLITLNESLKIATDTGERTRQASILSSMGNANIALGKTEEAEKLLQRGMIIAEKTDNPEVVTASLNNLGNLYTSMGKHEKAMATYRKSADSAKANGQRIVFAKAVSNEARAALLAGDTDRVRELLEGARQWIQTLDDSTEKAFILVHLAKSFELLSQRSAEHRALGLMGAHDSLHSAIQVSESIGENRARSYAQGNLGKLYQSSQRYMEAMYLTRQALESAQLAEAPESIYRWHWQEGKILWEIDQKQSAIDSYRRAVKILDETRQETMARYASSAGYFNKVISPVYLDLVDALIQVGESSKVTDEAAKSLARSQKHHGTAQSC